MEKMANVYQFKYKDVQREDCDILFGEVNQDRVDRLYKKEFSHSLDGLCYKDLDGEQISERMFKLFNSDDRPNGKVNRSISVGDIIEIDGVAYVCTNIGFEKMNLDLSKVQNGDNYKIY